MKVKLEVMKASFGMTPAAIVALKPGKMGRVMKGNGKTM